MPDLPAVRDAYARRADEYAALFGEIGAAAPQDRALVAAWAAECPGRIVDVGCGPGQWTAYLRDLGYDDEGIDPVPEFIAIARRRCPGCDFRTGSVAELGGLPATYGGVLCWYSLIHLAPAELPAALEAIRTCLVPGGRLLVGFVEGPAVAEFAHAVAPAHYWPMARLSAEIERAGFRVVATERRRDPGARPHGAIHAEAG